MHVRQLKEEYITNTPYEIKISERVSSNGWAKEKVITLFDHQKQKNLQGEELTIDVYSYVNYQYLEKYGQKWFFIIMNLGGSLQTRYFFIYNIRDESLSFIQRIPSCENPYFLDKETLRFSYGGYKCADEFFPNSWIDDYPTADLNLRTGEIKKYSQ